MTARLDITRAQAKAIAAAAKAMDCVFEIERDGVIYRVIPEAVAARDGKAPVIDKHREIEL